MKHLETDKLTATTAVANEMGDNGEFFDFVMKCLDRHFSCDWGDLDRSDKKANDEALENGLRILSAYENKELETKIWIITEADRSNTTILYPEEY